MKTKKNLLIAAILGVLLLNCMSLFAQVTLNVTQDAKLLIAGDDKGNAPGTIDLTFASEWRGNEKQLGFLFVRPEFEYADLEGGIYRRYSANVGYTFTDVLNSKEYNYRDRGVKIHLSASVGYGIIDYNGGWRGFGANFQTSFEIIKGFEFFLDLEIVDRQDQRIYGPKYEAFKERLIASGKFGFKFHLN